MSLHSELVSESSSKTCKVCVFLSGLPEIESGEWQSELRQPLTVVSNVAVVRALRRRGVPITEASVRRHRGNHS